MESVMNEAIDIAMNNRAIPTRRDVMVRLISINLLRDKQDQV